MATPSPNDAVTADDVLHVQFTHIRKGGYDTQEVDAFLDRVAATLDANAPLLPVGAMTGADVRAVQFSQIRKGGYDTQEVDNYLDQIVALLGSMASAPRPAAQPAPSAPAAQPLPPPPAPEPGTELGFEDLPPQASAPGLIASAAPSSGPAPMGPQLHDPGGAAQKLLAAAQQAADTLTLEAETAKREADEYASATRAEADEHAARVTVAAEAQAASIREAAADEARRAAEAARAAIVDEIDALEARRAELAQVTTELEAAVAAERAGLLAVIDGLRARVADELPEAPPVAAAVEAPPPAAPTAAAAEPATDVEREVAAAFDTGADDEPVQAPPPVEDDAAHPDAHEDLPEGETLAQDAPDVGDDTAIEGVGHSVFDLQDEPPASGTNWLDEEPAQPSAGEADSPPGGLFDIEADPDWGGAPGRSTASGESFFDELRQADAGDELGPLDEDTDAALSAFFEGDEPDRDRWRDRFGPS